jgi:hypothetical protein
MYVKIFVVCLRRLDSPGPVVGLVNTVMKAGNFLTNGVAASGCAV